MYVYTALMLAALKGHRDVAELLLDHGAALHIQDNHGNTAFMGATINGHDDVAELICQRGAAGPPADSQ